MLIVHNIGPYTALSMAYVLLHACGPVHGPLEHLILDVHVLCHHHVMVLIPSHSQYMPR